MDKVLMKRMKGLLALVIAMLMLWGSGVDVLAAWIDTYDYAAEILNGEKLQYSGGGYVYLDGIVVAGDGITGGEYTNNTGSRLWVETEALHSGDKLYLTRTNLNPSPGVAPGVADSDPVLDGNHTHELRWRIALNPTETTDGRMEYSCDCGHVERNQTISFLQFILERAVVRIEEAEPNAVVKVSSKLLRCITDEITEALLARPDVSLEVSFRDQGTAYTVTIPAGKAPTDGQMWYGVYYLGSLYGYSEIKTAE